MRQIALSIAALMLFASCVNYKGTFTANQDIKLVHSTVFGNNKVKTIPAGSYQTTFKFSSDEKVKLTFKTGGDDIEVKVKLPSGTTLPSERGAIRIMATRSGQQNNILGFVDTVRSSSSVTRTRESCSYTVYRRSCTTQCDSRRNCRQVCNRVPMTRYGYQDVEFRYEYTDRSLKLEVVAPGSDAILGEYFGEDRDVRKVYLYQGRCF